MTVHEATQLIMRDFGAPEEVAETVARLIPLVNAVVAAQCETDELSDEEALEVLRLLSSYLGFQAEGGGE